MYTKLFIVYKVKMLKKPSSQSVYEEVKEHLISIMQSTDDPVRIREEDLTKKLSISRTPVREALIRLESTGLVELRHGRGALLNPVTDKEYIEWLKIRELLEGLAAHEAALNASKRDVDQLYELFEPFTDIEQPSEEDFSNYAQVNVLFHQRIIEIADNSLLLKTWLSFGHRQTTYKRQTIKRLERLTDSMADHIEIIKAIENRDALLAQELAKKHVRDLIESCTKLLSRHN